MTLQVGVKPIVVCNRNLGSAPPFVPPSALPWPTSASLDGCLLLSIYLNHSHPECRQEDGLDLILEVPAPYRSEVSPLCLLRVLCLGGKSELAPRAPWVYPGNIAISSLLLVTDTDHGAPPGQL